MNYISIKKNTYEKNQQFLITIICNGSLNILKVLHRQYHNLFLWGNLLLKIAAFNGQLECLKYLINECGIKACNDICGYTTDIKLLRYLNSRGYSLIDVCGVI